METPKVSIVIPAYNHERYVGEAIRSVLDQTFQDFELIIINDGSTDQTEAEILKFKDDRIRYYSQENRGLSATLNRGIELARGEFFNFLPSDDAFFPEKLETQIEVFKNHPDLGVVFSYPQLVDAEGREIKESPAAQWAIVPFQTKEEIFPALFERNFLSAPTALIRMECFKKVGGFDESLKYAQDYDLWIRILKYYDVRLLKQPLVRYRWHGGNLTFQPTPETESERAKILLKAYKNLSIEEIFPILINTKEIEDYRLAYEQMAGHLDRSGIPGLAPLAQLYRDKAESMKASFMNLPIKGEKREGTIVELKTLRGQGERIHVLMETLTFDRGGLEQVVYNLSKGLDKDFFKIIVVAVEKGGLMASRCKAMGIPVEVLGGDKEKEYQEILTRYQIDLVVSHYSTFGVPLAFEKGIPTLSVIHNIYSWFPDNVFSEIKSTDPFVSRYIAVSEEVKEYARYRFNISSEKIVVIPNGIDLEEYFSQSLSKTIQRSDLELNDEDYVLINVASIGPPKGQNVVLAALEKTVREYPQIKVLSFGSILDEAYFQFLTEWVKERQLSDQFKWIGFVEDVRPYFQIADAFLSTSLIEGWPLSVMEAMLNRLPILVTQVGGVTEIIGDSGCGILLPNSYEDFRSLDVPSLDRLSRETSPSNAGEVAKAMKRFYKEKEYWKEAGVRGYERIWKQFNLQRMSRSYERELFSLYIASDKLRVDQQLRKIDEQEKLLIEKDKMIEMMTHLHHRLDSKIDLLEARFSGSYQNIERQLDYILIRLSLKERAKGAIYRLMKKIHRLFPVVIREKYREGYQRVFLNKVTPAEQKLFLNPGASIQKMDTLWGKPRADGIPAVPRHPIQEFQSFKEEIRKGLPLSLERFKAGHVSGLVSVVLPVYNQAYLLKGAIESVLNQTYQNFELIIVNDGSTDEIEKVLTPYGQHPKVRILNQENQKLPKALSNGFQLGKGEYFTWTSADNRMGHRQLEAQVEFLIRYPQVQMVYNNYDIIGEDGEPLLHSDYCPGYQQPRDSNHIHLPRDLSELNVVRNNYIGPCFMYRSWVGRLIGDYDATMFTMEDYDYWMTINAFFRIEHIGKEDSLYFNRVHADSLTGRKRELRIVEKTDRLMEFEKRRRDFYLKAFHVYLIGNDERLQEVEEFLKSNGNVVRRFRIPCETTQMERGKAVGIWIHSGIEKGLISRIIRENPHAFFVCIDAGTEKAIDGEPLKPFGMVISLSRGKSDHLQEPPCFCAEDLASSLYPILCKANIQLFRREESFARWNI